MEHQAQFANKFIFCLLFIFASTLCTHAQFNKVSAELVNEQISFPIRKEILSYILKADQRKLKCDLDFFSIKFIVNTASFACDSVSFSRSVESELALSISNMIKRNEIDWSKILGDINYSNNEKLDLIFPVYVSRDKCNSPKLVGSQWWEIFNELIIEGNSEVIILGSMSMHMNH